MKSRMLFRQNGSAIRTHDAGAFLWGVGGTMAVVGILVLGGALDRPDAPVSPASSQMAAFEQGRTAGRVEMSASVMAAYKQGKADAIAQGAKACRSPL